MNIYLEVNELIQKELLDNGGNSKNNYIYYYCINIFIIYIICLTIYLKCRF